MLYNANAREHNEGGLVWAEVARCVMEIEEEGIVPAPTLASDIPLTHRVRVDDCKFWFEHRVQSIHYLWTPYGQGCDTGEIYIPHVGCGSYIQHMPKKLEKGVRPTWIIGRGYM